MVLARRRNGESVDGQERMGAYNLVLDVAAACPRCHVAASKHVQFKYGHLWQHRYAIGDRVTWGARDAGRSGRAHVVVDGAADSSCDACGYDGDWDFYVFIDGDVVVRVEPADGRFDFLGADGSYLDLGEPPDGS